MDDKIRMDRIDDTDRELKGLENQGQVHFSCTECNTPLLVIQKVSIRKSSGSNVLTRVAVGCGFCNQGYSSVEQISGQFYPGAPNDDTIFEPIEVDDNSPETDVLFKAFSK